jgi:hypothetical protein
VVASSLFYTEQYTYLISLQELFKNCIVCVEGKYIEKKRVKEKEAYNVATGEG